ncbi:MAG: hypothetical protein ACE361_01115 [Aureliella sp.]
MHPQQVPFHRVVTTFLVLLACVGNALAQTDDQHDSSPIRLLASNPHYFEFRGRPTALITSAEHYGAVLNQDFDIETYLDALAKNRLNYTRIFTGSYVEIPGSFGIENNTLAPATGRFLAPWQRVDSAGLYQGERQFDLSKWNPRYFERLHGFVAAAGKRGIVVEVTLFCSTYQDGYWERNPFHPSNNVNNIDVNLDRKSSNTLNNGGLLPFQKALARKLANELNGYDNIIYEIQNEPWADQGVKAMRVLRTLTPKPGKSDWFKWAETASPDSLDWQNVIAKEIRIVEKDLPNQHLIAQNYTNFYHSLQEIQPEISILNFHYAWPAAATLNWGWKRPIGFDESGFAGNEDDEYLVQAWQFMLSGGALFNHLDYSFFVGHERGDGVNNAPGGGSEKFRRQLSYLVAFFSELDLTKIEPDASVVVHAPGYESQSVSDGQSQFATVLHGVPGDFVDLRLPEGHYACRILSPRSGKTLTTTILLSVSDQLTRVDLPSKSDFVALLIQRLKKS